MSLKKKILFFFLMILIFFIGPISILSFYVRHKVTSNSNYSEFINGLKDVEDTHLLSKNEKLNLGWYHNNYEDSFLQRLKFPKKKNSIRIGFFGGSFVEGDESPSGFSYPSQFERIINGMSPSQQVEIVNFGMGSYGMAQSYLLWKYLKDKADLDLIVIHPKTFHFTRDVGFLYPDPYPHNMYGPIHSRFIIHDGKLKHIPIKKDDFVDAADQFNSLFPGIDYIRYSYFIPPAWNELIIGSDYNYHINPLYYRKGDLNAEINGLYQNFFATMAKNAKALLVICDEPEICQMKNLFVEHKNIYFINTKFSQKLIENDFIYQSKCCHPSPYNHSAIATELSAEITRQTLTFNKVIHPRFLKVECDDIGKKNIDDIWLSLGDLRISSLVKNQWDHVGEEGLLGIEIIKKINSLVSLIFIQPINNGYFAVLSAKDFYSESEKIIEIETVENGVKKSHKLGKIFRHNDRIYSIKIENTDLENLRLKGLTLDRNTPLSIFAKSNEISEISIPSIKLNEYKRVKLENENVQRFDLFGNEVAVYFWRSSEENRFVSKKFHNSLLNFELRLALDEVTLKCPFFQMSTLSEAVIPSNGDPILFRKALFQ